MNTNEAPTTRNRRPLLLPVDVANPGIVVRSAKSEAQLSSRRGISSSHKSATFGKAKDPCGISDGLRASTLSNVYDE
uniref:Uncharacterized protein n=1 Tax=Steinernema glaseri TaxID=37863 RepID=A0A1I7YW99_9BILA